MNTPSLAFQPFSTDSSPAGFDSRSNALHAPQPQPDNTFWRDIFDNAQLSNQERNTEFSASGQSSDDAPGRAGEPTQADSSEAGRRHADARAGTVATKSTQRFAGYPADQLTQGLTSTSSAASLGRLVRGVGSAFYPSSTQENALAADVIELTGNSAAPAEAAPAQDSPVHTVVASMADGNWKLYVRAAGLTPEQAVAAAMQAFDAPLGAEPGRVTEIVVNGQTFYREAAAVSKRDNPADPSQTYLNILG